MASAKQIVLSLVVAASISVAAQEVAPPPLPHGAVLLDHVVAVINGSVILESDVNEEIKYAILQPLSVGTARNTPQRALQRLIDRDLILQQMKAGLPAAPPSPQEVAERLNEVRRIIPECAAYHCNTDAGWQA